MDTSVQSAYRKLCRACLRQYESRKDLISLSEFDTTQSAKIRFFDMLSSILHQTLPENDGLPAKICIMCVSSLRVSYFFRLEVEKSHNTLMKRTNLLSFGIKIKEEPVEKNNFPVILRPRHVAKEAFNHSTIQDEVPMESDNEIIDYEPEFETVFKESRNDEQQYETVENAINSSHDSKGDTECTICSRTFTSPRALHLHNKAVHTIKNCKYCNKKLKNKNQLKLHIKFKHADKYSEYLLELEQTLGVKDKMKAAVVLVEKLDNFHECTTCDIKFATKIALLKHHADCDSKCIDCGLKIPRRDFYFKHLENVHKYSSIDLSGYECPFCMTLFRTEKILQDHIQRLHPDENQSNADTFSEAGESATNEGITVHQCKICPQHFSSSKSLKQHTTLKHKDSLNGCEVKKVSNVPKYTKDEFFEKFIVKKSNDFYRCIVCRKDIFKRSIVLHLRTKHPAIRSHRCELCDNAFFRADYRQRHFAMSHPRDYKCVKCDVQFDRLYKFEAHMVKHGQIQKTFRPEEGTDRYDLSYQTLKYIEDATNFDYANDLETITDSNTPSNAEVPLTKDEFCDKYMVTLSENSMKCNICNVELQNSSIISHLYWKHALKKPLKCAFCNERVVKNNARVTHMARCHPNEYKCNDCGQQFSKNQQYADHMMESHRKKVTTSPSSGEEQDLHQTDMRFIDNRNDDEIIEEPENLNIEVSTIERLFGCQFCHKKFTSPKNLLIHKSHKHKHELLATQEPIQEPLVEEPISFDEFKQNWVEFMNQHNLKCLVCEKVLKIKNFVAHIKAKHCTSGAFLCALCPENFYRPENRIQHMTQNHRGMFFCSVCNIQFYRNSRYAKHMIDSHAIELDSYDSYEVDLNVASLKFLPFVTKDQDENSFSSTSVTESDVLDPMEEMMQLMSTTAQDEMSRTEFIERYIKSIGQERHCLACDKIFFHSSIYHHLIHCHASLLPLKCPFCDVRFERSVQRSKHLQLFHPDEYKCNECGLQFQKHAKFSDHMMVEHNSLIVKPKSILEERDLTSSDLKYVAKKSLDEGPWNEDEGSIANSTAYSDYQDENIIANIKTDDPEAETISFIDNCNSLVEIPPENLPKNQAFEDEMSYSDFKEKYLHRVDNMLINCLACNKQILKTYVGAHMRLWHSTSMIYNCELCSAGFRRSDYRSRHMAFQHPEAYKCPECSIQFYYSETFKDHLFTEHKINKNIPKLKHKEDIDVQLEKLKFATFIPEEIRLHNLEETSKPDGRNAKRRMSINVDLVKSQPAREKPTTSREKSPSGRDIGFTYKIFYNKYIVPGGEFSKCKLCNIKLSKLAVKKHIKRIHSTSKPYYCQLCDHGFFRVDDRMAHMKKVHPESFKCPICDVQFYLSNLYIDHMANDHCMTVKLSVDKTKEDVDIPFENLRFLPKVIGPSINASKTDGGFSREEFTVKFIRKVKNNGTLALNCTVCRKTFTAKQKRFHLLQNHAKEKQFGCQICPLRFISNFKRTKHMKSFHPNDFKCQICDIQFETSNIHANHMQAEHKMTIKVIENTNPYIDGDDMKYYETIVKVKSEKTAGSSCVLNIDESSSSQMETTHCDICKVDLDSTRSYRQHMRDHGSDFTPIIFENSLTATESEKKIVELPEVDRLFPCDICGKRLSSIMARNAHKKIKHDFQADGVKHKMPKQKVEVVCEICHFSSYRRDYLEHHMKNQHGSEFSCQHCKRILSSYKYFIYHVETNHHVKADLSKLFKCSDCISCFKLEENLTKHKELLHGAHPPKRSHFCELCSMDFKHPTNYHIHLETYTHKNISSFFNGETSSTVKAEPNEKSTIESREQADSEAEPATKRQRLSTDESISENDKLDYLKYLKTTENGNFKCGICGRIKTHRKYMLHHLKQHKEIPTYDCDICPERFVFKSKYDKHIELHKNGGSFNSIPISSEAIIENEHPKFQEVKKGPIDIRCSICNMTFKLTIILNKHNTTWHSDQNPLRNHPMQEQKQKRHEQQLHDKTMGKHLKCKKCSESFGKQVELDEHVKNAHRLEVAETRGDDEFNCERCSLKFQDKKFLENHQSFFCAYRFQSKDVNEQ